MKISLVLIVLNELQGCELDVPQIPCDEFYEVIAIDGGSTDGTIEYLKDRGISVTLQESSGLNGAYIDANNAAKGDAVIAFFPKGTYEISDLLKFRKYLEEGYDLVIASRQIAGSVNEEDEKIIRIRKWAVKSLAVVSALVWHKEGPIIWDVLHGFKAWKKNSFKRMQILDYGISIDIEMVLRSYKLKLRSIEFPIVERPRKYGTTHFKLWPTGKQLCKYLWFELFRKC